MAWHGESNCSACAFVSRQLDRARRVHRTRAAGRSARPESRPAGLPRCPQPTAPGHSPSTSTRACWCCVDASARSTQAVSTPRAWASRRTVRGGHDAERAKPRVMSSVGGRPGQVGALLRRHRKAAGLSQKELADAAGLSQRGISDLERGVRRRPYPATLRRLVAALGLGRDGRAELLLAAAAEDGRVSASGPPRRTAEGSRQPASGQEQAS